MRNIITSMRSVIAGGLLFSIIFFREKLAVNLVLFDLFMLAVIFLQYSDAWKHAAVKWLVLGHLISLAMLIVHNSDLSVYACLITLMLTVMYSLYLFRSPFYAGISAISQLISGPFLFFSNLSIRKKTGNKQRRWSRIIRFALLPVFLFVFFFGIYSLGNTALGEFAEKFTENISRVIGRFFAGISWSRFFLFLLGLIICSSLLLRRRSERFSSRDLSHHDELQRKRVSWAEKSHIPMYNLIETFMGKMATGMIALKNENTTGIISLTLLNVLLLLVNILDINNVWFNSGAEGRNEELYRMVHEGIYILIFSIVMAMVVVLFFFKGNLNFYKRNKWLKLGAYCWIAQNTFLVASVFMRDLYYIREYGLAYKRLGVLFFLLLVLIGLFTIVLKITRKRTVYYLLRVNAAAALVVLVLACTVHWDEFIAKYNLRQKDKIDLDIPFLLSLSDKTIPLLEENIASLQEYENKTPLRVESDAFSGSSRNAACKKCFVEQLKWKEESFIRKQSEYSWLSWNYSDSYVKRYLDYLSISR